MHSALSEREIEFLLYEFLDTESLVSRSRYQDHSREIFDAVLSTARKVADKYFADHYKKGDEQEPAFDGKNVSVIPETEEAWANFSDAGFLAARYDYEQGGMQMPETVFRAAMAIFMSANIATSAYPVLTIGVANLIKTFGDRQLSDVFLTPLLNGRFAGTMALTEPGQGSALADIRTTAKPVGDGTYRLFGNKMYISGGEQGFTENIVHMVLARLEGAPAGAGGISLFACPKFLINGDGSLGSRNDVVLGGVLHKMGYRNTTSTVLNFGEKEGAVGYLVGEANRGLAHMFQMMNEARIGVGLGAAVLGYQGFRASVDYASERPQGRLPSNKDPLSKQVPIIDHADVRRMLLAQKAYSEAALAMCLYASQLFEDSETGADEQLRRDSFDLLDLITPIVKSWPSKYGLQANDLAIQIFGGAGYTREYLVEQYYRDNRLNPIHEGAEAIHGIDLLGRKVLQRSGSGFKLFLSEVSATIEAADKISELSPLASSLADAVDILRKVTATLTAGVAENPDRGLANATVYLDVFGCVFAAWIWLKQALIAEERLGSSALAEEDKNYYQGKLQASKYFFGWELPAIKPKADLLIEFNNIPLDTASDWF